jgi:hypothetical protein
MPLSPPDGGQVMTAKLPHSATCIENAPVVLNLRDHFAGLAMQGMLSCQDFMNELSGLCGSQNEARAEIAKLAYRQADAMLAERQKERPGE